MLPHTNARLTLVRAGGQAEDYDRAAAAGADKWKGTAGVYLSERRERIEAAGTSSVIVTRSVVAPGALPVDWQEGDVLTLTPDGESPQKPQVRAVEHHRHPGAPSTVRLTLEDA